MKKGFFLVLTYLVASLSISAQINAPKIVGKILDQQTKQPVVYASIMLKNLNRGTHTDFDGFFEIPSKFYTNGIIIVSSIGFESKEIKLSNLKKDEINTIYLYTVTDNLD